jgi:hypothetical protein
MVVTMKKMPQTGRKNFATIDLSTGEVLPGLLVQKPGKGPKNAYERWWSVNTAMQIELAIDRDTAHMEGDNNIAVCQTTLAKTLGMKREQLSRSIRKLLDKNILLKGKKIGRSLTYSLNPSYGWNGCVSAQHKALKQEHERKQKEVEKRRDSIKLVPKSD